MGWNYRIMKHTHKTPAHMREKAPELPEYEDYYAIHEVYYDPIGWTKEPVDVAADNVDDLKDSLKKMLEAFDKPVLEYENEDNPPEYNGSK